jgi:hypothetical protein
LKALPGTVVPLIPAPGSNKLIIISSTTIQYRYGTTAYTIGNADNQLATIYHGHAVAMGIFQLATGFMDQTANQIYWGTFSQPVNVIPQTQCINLGVDLTIQGTTPALTLGDGTLEIVLEYTIVDLS